MVHLNNLRKLSKQLIYLQRKNRELTAIKAISESASWHEDDRSEDVVDVVARKIRHTALARARIIAKSAGLFPETFLGSVGSINHFGHVFEYKYQRTDLTTKVGDPYLGYLSEARRSHLSSSHCWYANSGMAAIVGIVESIISFALENRRLVKIAFTSVPYFETLRLMEARSILAGNKISYEEIVELDDALPLRSSEASCFRVLWLDTSSPNFLQIAGSLDRTRFPYDWVVVDTTCFLRGESIFDTICTACLSLGIPVALVRSHLKLDFLGCEYARLGSAYLMVPKSTSKECVGEIKGISAKLNSLRATLALNGALENIFPNFCEPEGIIEELNRERVERLRTNCFSLVVALEQLTLNTSITIRRFSHSLFFIVELKTVHAVDETALLKLEQLSAVLSTHGLPTTTMASFGSDYIGLVFYQDSKANCVTLRVAVSDFPECDCMFVATALHRTFLSIVSSAG